MMKTFGAYCSVIFLLLACKSANVMQGNGSDIFNRNNIKENMKRVAYWQLNNPKHAPTDWTNGAFYAGVVAAYQTTKDKTIHDSLIALGTVQDGSPAPGTIMQMISPSARLTLTCTG